MKKDDHGGSTKIVVEGIRWHDGWLWRWECRSCFQFLDEYSTINWYGTRFPLHLKTPKGYSWSSPWQICMEDAEMHIAWHKEYGEKYGVRT